MSDAEATKPAKEAWVELPPHDPIHRLMEASRYNFGFIPAMVRLVFAHESLAAPFASLFSQIMFGPAHLDRREREMVAAVAAAAQDCHY